MKRLRAFLDGFYLIETTHPPKWPLSIGFMTEHEPPFRRGRGVIFKLPSRGLQLGWGRTPKLKPITLDDIRVWTRPEPQINYGTRLQFPPDFGFRYGDPVFLTTEQARYLLWVYQRTADHACAVQPLPEDATHQATPEAGSSGEEHGAVEGREAFALHGSGSPH